MRPVGFDVAVGTGGTVGVGGKGVLVGIASVTTGCFPPQETLVMIIIIQPISNDLIMFLRMSFSSKYSFIYKNYWFTK